MTLVSDWKRILRYAWSIRWMIAAILLDAAAALLGMLDPPGSLAFKVALSLGGAVASGGALIARLLAQKEFDDGQ